MTTIKHKVGGQCEIPGCARPHYGRGLCKPHHQWQWKRGLLGSDNRVSLREKIERSAVAVTETGCWLWTGSVNNKGYGRVCIGNQKQEYAHRMAYIEFKGEIPDGMEVCHKCDTPSCCNPDHLFLGDHWENMQDASRKGRMRTIPVHGPDHRNASLTAVQVLTIRSSRKPATYWAKCFGCNPQTIRKARLGISYRNVRSTDDELLERQRALNAQHEWRAAA